jgi:hypothetical protein
MLVLGAVEFCKMAIDHKEGVSQSPLTELATTLHVHACQDWARLAATRSRLQDITHYATL